MKETKLTKEERDAVNKWNVLFNMLIGNTKNKKCKVIKLHKDKQ